MKIDFNGSYTQIARVLGQATRPGTTPALDAEFEKQIGALRQEKSSKSSADYPPSVPAQGQLSRGAGSMVTDPQRNIDLYQQIPEPERVAPLGESVVNPSLTVKTPTLLATRRMPSSLDVRPPSLPPQVHEIRRLVENAGAKHGIDPSLSMAVISAESSFNPRAVSNDGHASKGLFQLLDATGKDLLDRTGMNENYNPFDPHQNVDLGVSYLRYLHDLFSKDGTLTNSLTTRAAANSSSLEKLAVVAFNAGEGRVASAQMRAARQGGDPRDFGQVEPYLPESTREYVSRVFRSKPQFEDFGEG